MRGNKGKELGDISIKNGGQMSTMRREKVGEVRVNSEYESRGIECKQGEKGNVWK